MKSDKAYKIIKIIFIIVLIAFVLTIVKQEIIKYQTNNNGLILESNLVCQELKQAE